MQKNAEKSMKFCCGLNFLTLTFAARGRSDFLAEIVGRAAGTVLPGFFGPIHVHVGQPQLLSHFPVFASTNSS